jgi:hypothetical protein
MIALSWFPERRALMEKDLVRRYHASLLASGVRDYGWNECWNDYRRSVIKNLMVPVRSWAQRKRASLWWTALERAMLAYQDLGCEELLAG